MNAVSRLAVAAIVLLATDVSNNSVPAQTDFTTSFNLSDA